MAQKTLRPFFGFYGGKWLHALKYPSPTYHTIIEPFAGSAGYSLRYPDREIILCELDPCVFGVWSYLLRATPEEILALPDVPLDGTVDDLDIPQEARWLIGFWLNKGSQRPCRRPSSWMRSGLYPGSFWGDRVRRSHPSLASGARQLPGPRDRGSSDLVHRPALPADGSILHLRIATDRLWPPCRVGPRPRWPGDRVRGLGCHLASLPGSR